MFETIVFITVGSISAFTTKAADTSAFSHLTTSGAIDFPQAARRDAKFGDNTSPGSLPTEFFANNYNSTKVLQDSAAATDLPTTRTVTSFITINPPLVNVGSPNYLNPNNGTPVVVAPEPAALLSAFFCLSILGILKAYSVFKSRRQRPNLS